jgi:predicted porin
MKKILAVAIATAFAAPAFAATSNVDVYGSINLSYENVDNGVADWNRMVTNNNSFIGFKGSEDLGGGMKAVWQLETNIQPDGSQSNAADAGVFYGTRNSFLGLAGGFGTVVAGTHDTPYKMATGSLDVFVGTLGDYNAIFGNAAGNASAVFDLRTGNTIAYLSPKFGGFDVKAAYVSGLEAAEPAGQNTASAYSLSGTYANGPLFVTAAYEKHNDVAGVTTAQACNVGATCLGSGTLSRDAIKLGAGYKFGDLKLGAIYEKIDGDTGTAVAHDTWGVNAAYGIGAITLKASFATADDIENAAGVEVANTGADMWALGVDYSLSKRTTVQLTYANMDNDSAGTWDLGQGQQVVNALAGAEVKGFSLGVKHTF